MKKALRIIGIILLILILIIAGLTVWKWDLIKSVYIGFNSTPDEISKRLDDTQDSMRNNVETYTGIVFREPTAEEQALINSGKMTKAELFEKILNETIEEYLKKNETASSSETKYDRIVAEYTSKLYALKGKYIGMLDSLIGEANKEFDALPSSERTASTRSKIISKYINVASGYESSCDSEVKALLNSMKTELKAINADTSIVDAINEVYYEEKSLRISYYASKMK